jgi:Protein of unknown function (DUF3800)
MCFTEFKVKVLHAKQLHDTDGDFANWTVLRKQAFISRVCQARLPHLMMGLSISALKGTYKLREEESGRKRTISPYTFCFNVIIDWILRDIKIGRPANTEGVAFMLECGHENDPEAVEAFHDIRKRHNIGHILHSISFVPKESSRAIQLADLLAFYSPRDGVALYNARTQARESYKIDTMAKIITENLPYRSFVATDFGHGSRFLAGHL